MEFNLLKKEKEKENGIELTKELWTTKRRNIGSNYNTNILGTNVGDGSHQKSLAAISNHKTKHYS